MSKQTFFTALFLALLAVVTFHTLNVAAEGPLLNGATYIDNQWHYVAPGATVWFAFDYNGDRSVVTITLVDGAKYKSDFKVYPPDNPDKPIGRGTQGKLSCNNGDRCDSPDLTWVGGTGSPGTYYVQVINNSSVSSFLLTISGGGITLRPSVPPPSPPTIYSAPYIPPNAPQYGQPYVQPSYAPPYAQPYGQQYVPPSTAPPYSGQYGQPYIAPPNAPQYVQPYIVPSNYPQYAPQYGQPYMIPYDPGYVQPYIPYSKPRYIRQYYPRYVIPYYPYYNPQYLPPPVY